MRLISTERLNEIISAETDNRLIILPCKIGCEVFKISYCCDKRCSGLECGMCDMNSYIILKDKFDITMINDINKTTFLNVDDARLRLVKQGYKKIKSCNWNESRWYKNN